ncbi:hypothetical protein C2S51_004461 [Perilla frutescens var. frutescens]|nr:hypothetical protein C2S51_004461 [Perilla frutescens var. frutescens]
MMVKTSTGIPAKIKESTRFMPFFKNVLAACNFDLQFIYVLSGWEGKYFLVDFGFANRRQFLAPLRGVRYHLKDFGGQGRHLRNAKLVLACAGLHNFLRKECRSDEFPVEYEGDQDLPPPPPEEENMEWLSQSQLQQRTKANACRMSIANSMWEARPTYNGDGNDDNETEDGNAK